MRLHDELHELPFGEWNDLVRGVIEAWEVARLLGCERVFEQRLADDLDGSVTRAFAAGGRAVLDLRDGVHTGPSGEVSALVHSLSGLDTLAPLTAVWKILGPVPADEQLRELRAQVA